MQGRCSHERDARDHFLAYHLGIRIEHSTNASAKHIFRTCAGRHVDAQLLPLDRFARDEFKLVGHAFLERHRIATAVADFFNVAALRAAAESDFSLGGVFRKAEIFMDVPQRPIVHARRIQGIFAGRSLIGVHPQPRVQHTDDKRHLHAARRFGRSARHARGDIAFGRLIRKSARGDDRDGFAIALIDDIARLIGTKHMHVFGKLVAQTRPRRIRVVVARDEVYGNLRIA